ncbi:DUF3304 domain-containing protein [Ralstonia solanacearum]|nr:DUF3304 domain-containing protein [Ralstonia solanacearum]QKM24755.1 DUF3304 domain-containing protein [Ralstonia solanacearum]QKM29564.1 DUF3304 domain-containing protein [Ralstonia solanacearum]
MGLAIVLFVLLGAGCKPSQSETTSQEDELGLQVRVLNYMDEGLGVVYVNGVWAGAMGSHAGGTSIAGSIGLPAKWHPGLTVKVEWRDNVLYQKDHDALYKAQVPVEPYETGDPAMLWLAFLPDNKIRAIASRYTPLNPKFPGGLKFPEDLCKADPACAAKFY